MFRRRPSSPPPAWLDRFERARTLILEQQPPQWLVAQLGDVERVLRAADADRARLAEVAAGLDLGTAAAELKAAIRRAQPGDDQLVESMRERYESINRIHNRVEDLEQTIERALVDLDVLAVRSVELSALQRDWSLDDTVQRLRDDVLALERAHDEVAGL